MTTMEETSHRGITAETGDWEEVNIEKPADHANLIDAELTWMYDKLQPWPLTY